MLLTQHSGITMKSGPLVLHINHYLRTFRRTERASVGQSQIRSCCHTVEWRNIGLLRERLRMLRAAAHAQRATTHAQSDDERSESDCARSERDGVVVAGSVEDLFLVFVRSEARRQTTSVLDDEQRRDDDDRQQHDSAQHPAHDRRH